MSSFWCSKCGTTLYGDDEDTVSKAHKEWCVPQGGFPIEEELKRFKFYADTLLREQYEIMPRQRKFADFRDDRLADLFDQYINANRDLG